MCHNLVTMRLKIWMIEYKYSDNNIKLIMKNLETRISDNKMQACCLVIRT